MGPEKVRISGRTHSSVTKHSYRVMVNTPHLTKLTAFSHFRLIPSLGTHLTSPCSSPPPSTSPCLPNLRALALSTSADLSTRPDLQGPFMPPEAVWAQNYQPFQCFAKGFKSRFWVKSAHL